MDNNHGLLPDLRVFAAVVEHSSFTRAARELNTSPAAISRAVRRLEDEVGGALLHRTTRRVGLTELGSDLYGRSRDGLHHLQRALDEVKNSAVQPRGLLRVSCAQTFGRRFLAQAVFDFRILYPEIDVELTLTDELVDLVTSGFHVAIRGGRPRDARLISRPLAPLPLYTCASPALLNRHPAPRRPEDFRQLPCIAFRFRSTGERLAWDFFDGRRHLSLQVESGLCVDDMEVACDAAIAGLGFAQLPGYVALEVIRSGRLVPVLADVADASRSFSIVYLQRSGGQPLRTRLFVDHLLVSAADQSAFALTATEVKRWSATRPAPLDN